MNSRGDLGHSETGSGETVGRVLKKKKKVKEASLTTPPPPPPPPPPGPCRGARAAGLNQNRGVATLVHRRR